MLMIVSLVSIGQVRLKFSEVRDTKGEPTKVELSVFYNLDEKILAVSLNGKNALLEFLDFETIENEAFGAQTIIYAKEKTYDKDKVGKRCSLLFTNMMGHMVLDYKEYDVYGKEFSHHSFYQ